MRVVFKLNRPISVNDEVRSLFGRTMAGIQFMLTRTGALSMGASQACAFVRTRPGLEAPDIQYHVQPLSTDKLGAGLHHFSGVTMSTCQLRPESRGEILLKSANPFDYPAIHPNYLATETDRHHADRRHALLAENRRAAASRRGRRVRIRARCARANR